jgi:hypothetical protein
MVLVTFADNRGGSLGSRVIPCQSLSHIPDAWSQTWFKVILAVISRPVSTIPLLKQSVSWLLSYSLFSNMSATVSDMSQIERG